MDNCNSCLMLKEVRKLKVEKISFLDSDEKPAFCRACYQRERAENERLKGALIDLVNDHPGQLQPTKPETLIRAEQALKGE